MLLFSGLSWVGHGRGQPPINLRTCGPRRRCNAAATTAAAYPPLFFTFLLLRARPKIKKLIGRALRGILAGFFKTSDARQVVDVGASSVMNACRARLRMTPLALRVAKKGSYRYVCRYNIRNFFSSCMYMPCTMRLSFGGRGGGSGSNASYMVCLCSVEYTCGSTSRYPDWN